MVFRGVSGPCSTAGGARPCGAPAGRALGRERAAYGMRIGARAAELAEPMALSHKPTQRVEVLTQLLRQLLQVRPGQRALVGVDGFDGVGKTHLVGELAQLAGEFGTRAVLTVSIDGFHHPRDRRRAAGQGPEGFYRGSYRYDAFRECVVGPVRTGQPLIPAVWDVDRDRPATPEPIPVPADVLVLVDGIFLHRPELIDVWDATVWVHAPFEVSVPRGNSRYPGAHDPDPEAPCHHRYVGGQRLYLREVDPVSRATWLLDNTVLERPRLRSGPGFSGSAATLRPSQE